MLACLPKPTHTARQRSIHPFACLPCPPTNYLPTYYLPAYLRIYLPPPTHRLTYTYKYRDIDMSCTFSIYTHTHTDVRKHRHVTEQARTHTHTHTRTRAHSRNTFQHGRRGSTRSSEASIQPALHAARRQFVCSGRVLSCIAQSLVGVPSSENSASMQPASSPCQHCHVGHSRTSAS